MPLEQAQERFDAVVRAQLPAADREWRMVLVPAGEEHVREARPVLVILFGASIFMLFIACASVAGLLAARGAARRHEMRVRAALGAGQGRIVRQLLVESLLLAIAAGLAGALLADLTLGAAGSAIQEHLRVPIPGGVRAVAVDPAVLAFALIVSTLTGVLFGLAPALTAARADPRGVLRGAMLGGSTPGRDARARSAFVVTQIAITCALLVGAVLMGRTLLLMSRTELGFGGDRVLKANLLVPLARFPDGPARTRVVERLLGEVGQLPGVDGVAAVFPHPFRNRTGTPLFTEGGGAGSSGAIPRAVHHRVTPGYFSTMRIALLSGRLLTESDRADAVPVALVSETLARQLWPGRSALGHRIRLGDREDEPWRTVVGVVRDVRKTFSGEHFPDMYVPYAQEPGGYTSIVLRTDGDPALQAAALAKAIGAVDPTLALSEIEPMEQVIGRAGAQQRLLTTLIGCSAMFAALLAILGLYSTISYVVSLRRREFATRLALGASAGNVLVLILNDGGRLVIVGTAVGLLLSAALSRVLAGSLFGVTTLDTTTFVAVAFGVLLVGTAAVIAPARRAAHLAPAAVLRED